ncbi:hypothetical protein [Streptomyces sp. NBC_00442]|uniref:hypothetical protein n=1 Tax=Streptomyces sp. NBC_00442 TaxID=2903651 RepID=UPI003FA7135B
MRSGGAHGVLGPGGSAARPGGGVLLPSIRPAALGRDAVGVPAGHGFRLLSRLPSSGCVFASADWWWWIVPAGSDHELPWPGPVRYAPGAVVPDAGAPRLIHFPEGPTPYTPPIPLYLVVCQLTGTAPAWA